MVLISQYFHKRKCGEVNSQLSIRFLDLV